MGNCSKNSHPMIHFAAKYGWLNDPNGLVYHDGIYELYYQANPDDVEWDNMTWGHARSRDLLHWEELEPVMYPDENGMMYSGCGLRNDRKVLGLDEKALLFPYTAAYFDEKSMEPHFTIRLAYSVDGGMTLIKKEGTILDELAPDNRDPKVFWHEESKAFILVLWIEKNEMGIFRSEDFTHFELSERFVMDGGFECPDLMELPVCDENGSEVEKKWVFWAADGSYVVGNFDGYSFKPVQARHYAYFDTRVPYAAQTWSGDPKGRVLQIPWLRTKCINNQTTGTMGIPRQLSLIRQGEEYMLKQSLPEEILEARNQKAVLKCGDSCEIEKERAFFLHVDSSDGWKLRFYEENSSEHFLEIRQNPVTKALILTSGSVSEFMNLGRMPLDDIDIIYDAGIVEATTRNDVTLNVAEIPQLRGTMCKRIEMTEGNGSITVFTI